MLGEIVELVPEEPLVPVEWGDDVRREAFRAQDVTALSARQVQERRLPGSKIQRVVVFTAADVQPAGVGIMLLQMWVLAFHSAGAGEERVSVGRRLSRFWGLDELEDTHHGLRCVSCVRRLDCQSDAQWAGIERSYEGSDGMVKIISSITEQIGSMIWIRCLYTMLGNARRKSRKSMRCRW